MEIIKSLWAYRGFILGTVKREFQSKYRNSLLGAAWTVINPLAMIIVYTVVFSQLMRAKLPEVDGVFGYSIFLCAGSLAWGLFVEITTRSQSMFLDNSNLLKKLNFPRLCLPISIVVTGVLNFLIVFGLFTLFLLVTGNFPGLVFISLVPLFALLIVFSAGLGMVLGVLNVFFRDVGQFFNALVPFWFWFTPIVYPPALIPEWVRPFAALNPIASLIGAVQNVLVLGAWPIWGQLHYPIALALMLCILGLRLFHKRSAEMADEL